MEPLGIQTLNKTDLPGSNPAFDLLLPPDRAFHVRSRFDINQPDHLVPWSEPLDLEPAVLAYPARKVPGYADIQSAGSTSHDVDVERTGRHSQTMRGMLPRPATSFNAVGIVVTQVVILSKAKNPYSASGEILRCAQDDNAPARRQSCAQDDNCLTPQNSLHLIPFN
jgi:hypothetical protein